MGEQNGVLGGKALGEGEGLGLGFSARGAFWFLIFVLRPFFFFLVQPDFFRTGGLWIVDYGIMGLWIEKGIEIGFVE